MSDHPDRRADRDAVPPDSIRRRNPRLQGDIGVGAAIAHFLARGWRVFVPLSESQRYDLVVDAGDGPLRVQVKTTTHRNARGRFCVQLKTCGGNQSWNGTVAKFDPDAVDLLFVLTDAGERYLVPAREVKARSALTLGAHMEAFRVEDDLARWAGKLPSADGV